MLWQHICKYVSWYGRSRCYGSIFVNMSVDIGKVGVMAAYLQICQLILAKSVLWQHICKYPAITPTKSISTDTIEPLL